MKFTALFLYDGLTIIKWPPHHYHHRAISKMQNKLKTTVLTQGQQALVRTPSKIFSIKWTRNGNIVQ